MRQSIKRIIRSFPINVDVEDVKNIKKNTVGNSWKILEMFLVWISKYLLLFDLFLFKFVLRHYLENVKFWYLK